MRTPLACSISARDSIALAMFWESSNAAKYAWALATTIDACPAKA